MFERLIYVGERETRIALNVNTNLDNVMNLPIVIEDSERKILGEVKDVDVKVATVKMLGEITDGKFTEGVLRKPNLSATIRPLQLEELFMIVGEEKYGNMEIGTSPFYGNKKVYVPLNNLFSNHMAIFGNSGSGKSWGTTRFLQNVFRIPNFVPYRSNFIIFDASGEYYSAFSNMNLINPNYNYRFITTSTTLDKPNSERLNIPIWLMDSYDLSLILQVKNHVAISILEKALKIVKIFARNSDEANKYKNHLIARAIMNILYSSQPSASKRDEVFSVLNTCTTAEFSRETVLHGIGYTRKFQDCFLIDTNGQFSERVLLTEYVSSFIDSKYEQMDVAELNYYTLEDLEKALNFTLISEGYLKNENVYADAITLRVKLHELVIGENSKFFKYPNFITKQNYVKSLIVANGKKYQIININLEDVDDRFASSIVKVISKMIFEFSKEIERASLPFNLFVEEAHRYIKNDNDGELLGYNIFDRIAKEGRKYGVIITLVSQRPVDISETVISQCSNFLIFKMSHPRDIDYITKMISNITEDVIDKQKALQVGKCLVFGSAFKIPMIIKVEAPDPIPHSSNSDVLIRWVKN